MYPLASTVGKIANASVASMTGERKNSKTLARLTRSSRLEMTRPRGRAISTIGTTARVATAPPAYTHWLPKMASAPPTTLATTPAPFAAMLTDERLSSTCRRGSPRSFFWQVPARF